MRLNREGRIGVAFCAALLCAGWAGCSSSTTSTSSGVVDWTCRAEGVEVFGEIDMSRRWDCELYRLQGQVFVTNDATLTVAPGTTVVGDTGGQVAALVVTRGAQLVAEGTATEPIVFTSGQPTGERQTGAWGGIALLGAAGVNDGSCVAGAGDCDYIEQRIEGIDVSDVRAVYGGTDDAGSCGSLKYVRIEFAGRELSPENELNGLTVGGCGSGTSISYVQVHRGKDDGVEFFGGTATMDHVVISGAADDGLDFDNGWRGNGQFVVIHQFPGLGDNGIEADNLGSVETAEPRSNPTLFNFTMLGTDRTRAFLLREGVRGTLRNFVVADYGQMPNITAKAADPNTEWPAQLSVGNSFFTGAVADFAAEDLDTFDAIWMAARAETWGAGLPAARPQTSNGGTDFAKVEPVEVRNQYRDFERDRYNDDLGFDERTAFSDAARANVFGVDPQTGSVSITAPNYVPANTALNNQATPSFNPQAPAGFGDSAATYAGAFAPGGADWTSGWTAFPEN